jgi:hypothetical protein
MINLSYEYNKQDQIIFIAHKIINNDNVNDNKLNFIDKFTNACWSN